MYRVIADRRMNKEVPPKRPQRAEEHHGFLRSESRRRASDDCPKPRLEVPHAKQGNQSQRSYGLVSRGSSHKIALKSASKAIETSDLNDEATSSRLPKL